MAITLTLNAAPTVREILTAARTYYVRSTGSDSATGLTTGTAFLTRQHAYDTIVSSLDTAGKTVTIDVGSGTWTDDFTISTPWVGGGRISISGAGSTSTTLTGDGISTQPFNLQTDTLGQFLLQSLTIEDATGESCLNLNGKCFILNGSDLTFGTAVGYHVVVSAPGAFFISSTSYKVKGGALAHFYAQSTGAKIRGGPISIDTGGGAINFGQAFAQCGNAGNVRETSAITIASGSVTGVRYNVTTNGVIDTNGSGPNYFPGDSAGTSATGGQYI